jgi:16S rRNA (cytidine1402-2'-O)-methyltransferase
MSGKLFLCGTPIGNLEDITYRVVSTLKACDVVYAEDTRHSIRLLNHFQISKPLHSYHEHNMVPAGKEIMEKLKRGEQIALVTDAGMPGISDPGEALVKLCIENELDFEVIPGVTAFTTALVGSGLDTSRFVFEAFLSRDKKQKRALLEKIKKETRTILFYESPHRLKETLKVMQEVLGDRKLVLARELTKKFEEFRRGTIESILSYYETHEIKGEIVLVVEGYQETESDLIVYNPQESVKEHVNRLIAGGIDKKEAMKIVASERKIKKTEVYAVLIED